MWITRTRTRLKDLDDRVWKLEQQLKTFELTIDEVLDKTRRWMHRAIRRTEREEAGDLIPAPTPPGLGLDPVSKKLLDRRYRALGSKLPTEEEEDGVLRR